ncbi:MAG: hypothetical protein WAN87_03475 [Thermoplasmata archaeon]
MRAGHLAILSGFVVIALLMTSVGNTLANDGSGTSYGWSVLSPKISDPSLFSTNLAWDPAGYEMAVVTGPSGYGTYALEGNGWVNLHVRTPVCTGVAPMLVDDESDGYMLLIDAFAVGCGTQSADSPSEAGHALVQLWRFQEGFGWDHINTPTGPRLPADCLSDVACSPGAVYDVSDGYVLLYGGFSDGRNFSVQTWSYHAGAWTEISGSAPFRGSAVMTYDPNLGKVLLVGYGWWTYHAGAWKQIFPVDRPVLNQVYQYNYDPKLQALMVSASSSYPSNSQNSYMYLWKDGSKGFTNITSETVNADFECIFYGNVALPTYDPLVHGLVCEGYSGGVWKFA